MSMPSIRGSMRFALLAAASIGFSGAQRVAIRADEARPLAFDPLALLRRPPRKERTRTGTWWRPHCGSKEARKNVERGRAGDDSEWLKRMAWNEAVYPRVLAHQAKQRRDAAGVVS